MDITDIQSVGAKAKRSRSDLAQIIAGTYTVSGKLLLKGKQDDFFPEIKVIVEKIERTHVSVRIVESEEKFLNHLSHIKFLQQRKGSIF